MWLFNYGGQPPSKVQAGHRRNDVCKKAEALQCLRFTRGMEIMNARTRVLVLEDSLIIAMEAEDILRLVGADTIDIANSLDQARDAIQVADYDFALLDVNLGEAMSFDFARDLSLANIPFGFVSGYSDTQDFPTDLQDVPLLVKPFDENAMRDFLQKLFPTPAE
ncbi:chemotaxis protein CheY [Rhizobium viscosum]|nr:chemotaxis protein CheY [Rhizobium viscosum]